MLRFLRIKRLAVIDSAEVEFQPGLNVLTGETGAGKSILVEAVGLLLGGRASADLVRTGEDSATVEAIFESGGDDVLIRREITAQGRSRAFINGELAPISGLKELSGRLIELHGQLEHHTLLDPSTHLGVLDAFAGLEPQVQAVTSAFERFRQSTNELVRVQHAVADRDARQEIAAFQLSELEKAAPTAGEDEELAALRRVLAGAERVERLCTEGYASLYESDDAVLTRLSGVWKRVSELAELDTRFRPYLDARDGVKGQLEDLAAFLRDYAAGIQASPERLRQAEERLALLERLKRKYGPALSDVIAKRNALRTELADLQSGEERIAELQREHDAATKAYLTAAEGLSRARRAKAPDFSRRLIALLGELAMEQTRFEVRFGDEPLPEGEWSGTGIDAAEFFVSPNPGEELRPMARIVSGGELSRIMLAIKTLTASSRHGLEDGVWRPPSMAAPGLIFDEIDAGIGGRVADVVGRKLRALGSAFQVLCITHLPQIAASADTHFQIEKRVERGRTLTGVTRLEGPTRVDEIGRMLGGELTPTLRATAADMLASRSGGKSGLESFSEAKAKGESERRKSTGEAAHEPKGDKSGKRKRIGS